MLYITKLSVPTNMFQYKLENRRCFTHIRWFQHKRANLLPKPVDFFEEKRMTFWADKRDTA